MKMPRIYTFDVPDFDDCGGRTTRRVEVPKAVFRQIEADVAAPLEATIHQLGENAAKAAGEYAEEVAKQRETLAVLQTAHESEAALIAERDRLREAAEGVVAWARDRGVSNKDLNALTVALDSIKGDAA